MFLDDSACNLASLNLMKFRNSDGTFDTEAFKNGVATLILAQEIIVDDSSYPTEQIQKNSHAYRPLGLGYANLGALLMASGLPYDSDEGRAYASAITALMGGEAYATSATIAKVKGPFQGYHNNAVPFTDVMELHREASENIDDTFLPNNLLPVVSEARDSWGRAVGLGLTHGYRNAQVTVLSANGDHWVHDGLRYHWGRARHCVGEVQEDGRWGADEDRQPNRATRFVGAWLQHGGANRNPQVH